MIIKVTQEDIDKGRARDCKYCPIALAIQRAFNNPDISVTVLCIYDTDTNALLNPVAHLPEIAQNFIIQFDSGLRVNPFEFEIPEMK